MPRRIIFSAVLILGLALPVVRARSQPAARCFPTIPAVVDCLNGRFAQYWQQSGGLPVFGYPITPLYDTPTGNGLVLAQMVERNRLEYHPELPPPYDILLGRLGEDLLRVRGRDWRGEPRGIPREGCWYAAETEHTVCDQEPGLGFLTYYRTHGLDLGDPGTSERESLALWGLPLTEPAIETNGVGDVVLTQWFERARFEYHPDQPTEYRVLQGLLGRELWGTRARPAASHQPAPAPIDDLPSTTPLPRAPATQAPAPTATRTPAPTRTPTARPAPSPTATPSPDAALAPPSPESDEALKQRLFDLVDELHQAAGCAPFVRDSRLDRAAQAHAEDIAAHRRVDHVGTDGATLRQRLDRVGYPYNRASESIAVYKSPEGAVAAWMDEPPNGPHRLNITNCQYIDAGVGLAYDNRGYRWWVMDVTNRRSGN